MVAFKINKCFCPGCGRPASVYHCKHGAYLRCTFADCPTNYSGNVTPIDTFKRLIENAENAAEQKAVR